MASAHAATARLSGAYDAGLAANANREGCLWHNLAVPIPVVACAVDMCGILKQQPRTTDSWIVAPEHVLDIRAFDWTRTH